jgi:hypothetical protein
MEYRFQNYINFKVDTGTDIDYYMQCEIVYNNQSKRIWIPIDEVGLNDKYIELKENDEWEGIPWNIINISPKLELKFIIENYPIAKIYKKNEVRDYKKWHK